MNPYKKAEVDMVCDYCGGAIHTGGIYICVDGNYCSSECYERAVEVEERRQKVEGV